MSSKRKSKADSKSAKKRSDSAAGADEGTKQKHGRARKAPRISS